MTLALKRTVRAAVAVVLFPVLVIDALRVRRETFRRRRRGLPPRIVIGPTPLINSKYLCRALRARGFEASTLVYEVYSINGRKDFDVIASDLEPLPRLPRWIRSISYRVFGRYLTFLWLLPRFDIFQTYFDGGFLGATPLQFRETALLHLAGKKVVVMPYGSDVAIPSAMRSLAWRQGLMTHYPDLGRRENETRRRLDYFSRTADFIVACLVHFETLPRWDLLTTLYYPIDTAEWSPAESHSVADGHSGRVVIVHAPNHRALKGTAALIDACGELEAEGYDVELRLLERLPNAEVHRIMAEADIVADQFILGFAMTALEGMSLALPVLSNLSEPDYYEPFRLLTGLDHCPIVDTPPARLKESLRRLVVDPALRREIGEAGRRYVETYHAYEPVGRMWEAVYGQVWFGRPLGRTAWDPTFAETVADPA